MRVEFVFLAVDACDVAHVFLDHVEQRQVVVGGRNDEASARFSDLAVKLDFLKIFYIFILLFSLGL